MTESSYNWTTSGTGDGPAAGYTAADLFTLFRALFTGGGGANYGGVMPDSGGELAVTGSTSPVAVASGAAVVYGIPYFNSASLNVTVATPASATRIDRIVLRASWSGQTVRITRIAGTEGAGTPPAMTQSAGTTWDIPLATVSITTGGAITVTDAREWLQLVGDLAIVAGKIAASAVTTAKLADDAVTVDKIGAGAVDATALAANAVTTTKILDDAVTVDKIGSGAVDATALAANAVTTAKILDANVTDAKLANMAQATVKGRASGAGTGVPVGLTAAQLVTIIATADGAGTTLDADLLDGSHAAAFATASHTHGASDISDDAVTNAKLANMVQATVKGRANAAGTGDPTDLTAAQLVAIVGTADGAGSGLDADTLDGSQATAFATASHTHDTTDISNDAVTNAKLANMVQATIKGRANAAGTGDPTDLTGAQVVTILNAAGGIAADTLDGSHASAFADAPTTWVNPLPETGWTVNAVYSREFDGQYAISGIAYAGSGAGANMMYLSFAPDAGTQYFPAVYYDQSTATHHVTYVYFNSSNILYVQPPAGVSITNLDRVHINIMPANFI